MRINLLSRRNGRRAKRAGAEMAQTLSIASQMALARPFDVHSHTGADIDGTTRTSAEHIAELEAIASVAAEARAPVLIHAGLGVGSFGQTILTLAQRHPDCPIVLAHAAISDLCWLWEEVVADLLAEGARVTQEAPWALALAIALLLTPGVESAVAIT